MSYLDTPHKKKSAVLTTIIMSVILYLIFAFGMTYLDPPEEYGIAVNFGTSDVGSGSAESEPAPTSASEEMVEEVTEEVEQEEVEEVVPVEEAAPEPVTAPTKAEDVATQDNAETIRINKQKEAKRKANEIKKKQKEADLQAKLKADRIKKQKQAVEAKKRAIAAKKKAAAAKKAREQASKRKGVDGLFDGLNNGKGKGKGKGKNGVGGDGDDNKAGNKGNPNGDPNASGYYGNGGGGKGGNYRLGNRRAVTKPKPIYDCNEQGKVVVKISVDKSGRVLTAKGGAKGTTNSAPCLIKRAEAAARKTKFNSDGKAPSKQVGTIIYNFSLSN
ncbi:MAG TPA: energy transducer TonB [Flavobacteriaceae bacterium]|jgi:outer membrane biosynthesis protein TonB|nr:energy transducer TonB [Flavobacteriaceae bacterium]HBS10999.1 energy transducer TonB [Flavobacteriaceae bacterium]